MYKFNVKRVYDRAVSEFFGTLKESSQGALATDQNGIIVWMDDKYPHLLGIPDAKSAIGKLVTDVIPGSLIPDVLATGEPILLDVMEYQKGWCVVSRFPIKDDDGAIIGAFGFVLYESVRGLEPLVARVRALQTALQSTQRELVNARRARYTFDRFVGTSPAALAVKREARQAATSSSPVILLGETGVGKEILAQAIHVESQRRNSPFVAINVSAVPDTLLEAEFFGTAPGAYTGADRKGRVGKMQLADGGTLFLDEIGDMPLSMQVKLLRALQERQIEPLGSNKLIKTDIRVIAATSRDLDQLVADGSFRADLYYRLCVLPIHVPPLRERLSDLRAISESILDIVASENGRSAPALSDDAIAALKKHSWPGNVRELRNILERASLSFAGSVIHMADILRVLPATKSGSQITRAGINISLPDAVADLERRMIADALHQSGGHKERAAQFVGLPRSTFYIKLRQYSLG